MIGDWLPDIIFYPLAYLFGYVFMVFKYRDDTERKKILKKDYGNSYAEVGRVIGAQFFIGLFAILIGICLISLLIGLIYKNFIK